MYCPKNIIIVNVLKGNIQELHHGRTAVDELRHENHNLYFISEKIAILFTVIYFKMEL